MAFNEFVLFQEAVRQSPVSVVITNTNGDIEYVNPKFERLTGYTFNEVKGKNPRVLNSGYTPPEGYGAMWSTLLSGQAWHGEFRNRKKNGDLYWEHASISPMMDADGVITHFMAIKEDITESKRQQDELRKLSKAVDQSPASIVITNTDGEIVYVNPKFERLTGYTLSEVRGQNPRILQSGETDPAAYRSMWDAITSGQEWHGEFHNRKKNGALYWEYASISPVVDDDERILYFLAVKEDVTVQKDLELSLRQALTTIEHQQQQMLEELEQARITQRTLMPTSIKREGDFRISIRYESADAIGGDFLDVVRKDDNRIAFVVADVTGHGVSAALISFLFASEFRHALNETDDPSAIMNRINTILLQTLSDDRFATAFIALVDGSSGKLTYAAAGHPDALLVRADGSAVERLATDGFLLGMLPESAISFEQRDTFMHPGDRLVLYSDAYSEAAGADGEQLGIGGFADLLAGSRDVSMDNAADTVHARTLAWSGQARFDDDATLLIAELQSR